MIKRTLFLPAIAVFIAIFLVIMNRYPTGLIETPTPETSSKMPVQITAASPQKKDQKTSASLGNSSKLAPSLKRSKKSSWHNQSPRCVPAKKHDDTGNTKKWSNTSAHPAGRHQEKTMNTASTIPQTPQKKTRTLSVKPAIIGPRENGRTQQVNIEDSSNRPFKPKHFGEPAASKTRKFQPPRAEILTSNAFVPLPERLQDYSNLYHLKSMAKPPEGWTCGYHALHNAKILEEKLGFDHGVDFESTALAYSDHVGKSPRDGATNQDIELLGKGLNLAPICNVKVADDGTVEPLISEPITVSVALPAGASDLEAQKQLDHALADEIRAHQEALLSKQKAALDREGCAHFVGHTVVDGEPHGVLISVVKQPDGTTASFIFDNNNQPIPHDSPLCDEIEFIGNRFLS